MTWLFGQLWLLLLIAFAIGALIAYFVIKGTLPHADDLEAQTGRSSEGAL